MPSYKNEWIPLRSAARTAVHIAQPPSPNALLRVSRVNHSAGLFSGAFSGLFFGLPKFKSHTPFPQIVDYHHWTSGDQNPHILQRIPLLKLCGIVAGAWLRDKNPLVRSHQLRPA